MSTKSCPVGVLVLEDQAPLRETIGAFLEERRYPAAVAESLEQALDVLDSLDRPCLVLADPMTLRIDWERLFDALGPNDRVATMPIVLESLQLPTLLTRPVVRKRIINLDILLAIVQDHCCSSSDPDSGKGRRPRAFND
jgi:CheY-like chemotaxis protein